MAPKFSMGIFGFILVQRFFLGGGGWVNLCPPVRTFPSLEIQSTSPGAVGAIQLGSLLEGMRLICHFSLPR